jgi:hypothetical protein
MLGAVNHHGTNNRTTYIKDDTSSLPRVNNSEPGVMEADSMSKENSLVKCRMEEVLVSPFQSAELASPWKLNLKIYQLYLQTHGCMSTKQSHESSCS